MSKFGELFQKCLEAFRFNTLRSRQNCRHFTDNIFKSIFLNKNVWISLKISLEFVPKVRINDIAALVEIMAWCRLGNKPSSEHEQLSMYPSKMFVVEFSLMYIWNSTQNIFPHKLIYFIQSWNLQYFIDLRTHKQMKQFLHICSTWHLKDWRKMIPFSN